MTDQRQVKVNEKDPRMHVANIRKMLQDAETHARSDVTKIQDDHAKALFEVTAEVLQGLIKAYDDYAAKNEQAWK